MSDVKNIVIIGASVAGHSLANYLTPYLPTTHRILLIDANDFAYWAIGGIRAAVVPGWEERVAVPLNTATVFAANTAHRVIAPNKVLELRKDSVLLEKEFEGSAEVPFFKCIIATGVLQPSPMRAELGSSLSGMQAQLRKLQTELGQASKIVVIGGGPVGLEFAGEARDRLPDASITVVHNQSRVLNPSSNPNPANKAESWSAPSSYPKLSTALEAELKAMNIDVILEDRVEVPAEQQGAEDWDGSFGLQAGIKTVKLKSGKSVQADFVFVSVGNKPGSGLVQKADEGAVQGGMVTVDEYLRIKSSNPSTVLGNYYAIGDVCNTPGWKTAQTADMDAKYAATAVLADVKGTKAKKYARGSMHMLAVPLGKSRGAASMTVPILGTFLTPRAMVSFKSKDLLVGMTFLSAFKGAEKVTVPDVKA